MNLEQKRLTILPVYEDNAATICISHSASLRETTKHLGYRRGFLREEVEKKEVVLLPMATSLQTADLIRLDQGFEQGVESAALRPAVRGLH